MEHSCGGLIAASVSSWCSCTLVYTNQVSYSHCWCTVESDVTVCMLSLVADISNRPSVCTLWKHYLGCVMLYDDIDDVSGLDGNAAMQQCKLSLVKDLVSENTIERYYY